MDTEQFSSLSPPLLSFKSHFPDELEELVPGWDQECIPLKKGEFFWQNDVLQIGDFQFYSERFDAPVISRGWIPKDTLVIGLPRSLYGNDYYGGHLITPQSLPKGCDGQDFDLKVEQRMHHLLIGVPMDQLINYLGKTQSSLSPKELRLSYILTPDAIAYNHFRNYMEELFNLVKTQSLAPMQATVQSSIESLIMADLLPLLANVLIPESATDLPRQASRYRQLVKRADAFIQDQLDHPITLQELCEHLATSQRSLYYAFQAVYGLPPMDYIKAWRLTQVRRALRKADPTIVQVSGIATRFGFWHMSQFSNDYKKMFGESPSMTLKSGSKR